jgi:hypothetical protein
MPSTVYDTAYEAALEYYEDKPSARKAANIARRTFAMRSPVAPKTLRPPPTAEIGRLLALEVVGRDGTFYVHRWAPSGAPRLYWSDELRAYMAFPSSSSLRTKIKLSEKIARKASSRWNARWGHPGGRRRTVTTIPTPKLTQQGAVVRVVYRSNFGITDDWQHWSDPGPRAWLGPGTPPSAILVRGGNLTMTSRGLEH